ncbi:c-type cytochrome [Roseovarius sp. C7]|uniref:c-type cytochrome n=1 Tax=Roseovarius sp. C7 TaxID=3398643 RepID=UPI0039F6D5CC
MPVRSTFASLMALALTTLPLHAEGDPEAGEKAFKKCRACHMVADGDRVIFKGGKTGPNLYGLIGRPAAAADYRYSPAMEALGESGFVWDAENFTAFMQDPVGFVKTTLDDNSARTRMMQKLKADDAADVAAWLVSVGPDAAESGS